ncbi:carboxylesterase [Fusarium circinatum]|uniref:Carboxylesterase n=1 Tax=Fusarium circinatum TaxID=48490 RepID=A0A8H5TP09_FUSCI|nr:carboxylesterase [Fusarium circinatum]
MHGSPDLPTKPRQNIHWFDQTGAIIISVNYAKAPQYPYPHALLQAYKALRWSLTCSATLEGIYVNPSRVAIGELYRGPCSIFRDALPLDFKQVLQFMLYPSLELRLPYDLRLARSTINARNHSLPAWMARAMEQSYLPPRVCKDDIFVSPVAASGDLLRELDVPPAVLFTGSLDCLKEEGFRYAQHLVKSDKVHEFEGGTYGFSVKPQDGSKEAQVIFSFYVLLDLFREGKFLHVLTLTLNQVQILDPIQGIVVEATKGDLLFLVTDELIDVKS